MTANTAIQYVNKPNNREGEIKWRGWLHSFWPVVCLAQRAADLKEQLMWFIVSVQHNAFFVFFLCCWPYTDFYMFMTLSDILTGCLLSAFKTSLLKKLIIFVSECQSEGTAENLKRQRTHVCQPEHPENSLHEYAKPNFKPTAGGNFGCVSQPESTNSVEAQCQLCHTFKHC